MDLIKLSQSVVRNPMFRGVVHRGFEVRDAALQAQTALLGAMNLPTAEDLATIANRLRSISQRLELLEDAVARVDQGVSRIRLSEPARDLAQGHLDVL